MAPYAEQLREASILIESAATAVGARVSAFTFGAAWERLEPPAEGAPLVALGRELHPHGGTPFGPAVAGGGQWLGRQPYARRRLWVLSDGQWSARDRAAAAGRPDLLRDVLVWVFADTAPEPPTPAMRIVAARTLDDLIRIAPDHFWGGGDGGGEGRLPGAGGQRRRSGADGRPGDAGPRRRRAECTARKMACPAAAPRVATKTTTGRSRPLAATTPKHGGDDQPDHDRGEVQPDDAVVGRGRHLRGEAGARPPLGLARLRLAGAGASGASAEAPGGIRH